MNRSRPQQQRFTPVRECRNIRGEGRNHFGNPINRSKFHVRNLKRKLRDGETFDRSLDVLAEYVRGTHKSVEQLRLCKIGNHIWRTAAFDQSYIEGGRTDLWIVGKRHF